MEIEDNTKDLESLRKFKELEAKQKLITVLMNDGSLVSFPYIADPLEMQKLSRKYNLIGLRHIIKCEVPTQDQKNTEDK